jgi:hypothetical protein
VIERFADLVPPLPLRTADWWLEPLGPEHADRDHHAWMSSIDHIRATQGFGPGDWGDDAWPYEMSAEANLADLEMHAREFVDGTAYAYSVLANGGSTIAEVIGCVYVDPDSTERAVVAVRSWVTQRRASLDHDLASAVDQWLRDAWGAPAVRWPGRPELGSAVDHDT